MKLTDDEINNRFNQMDYPSEKMEEVGDTLSDIAGAFITFAEYVNERVPDTQAGARFRALMFTALEEAQMWAEKATKNQT